MGPGVTVLFAILVLIVSGLLAIMLRSHSVAEGFASSDPLDPLGNVPNAPA